MHTNTSSIKGFSRSALALAIATTLPMGNALAADIKELPAAKVSAQTEDSYKVDESASVKYTQPLLDTAKTISVVPASVMKDRNVDSLRDALRNVPGISMAAGEGGTPTGDQMSIRGFSSNNNIMIDGVRDIAGYTRDTYNVEAIEVAKGPGSAVYGRGSAGGSINLQTKTAKLEDFTDISLRLGNVGDYRAKLDTNIAVGETSALRVNALSDQGDVAGRDHVENGTDAIALSFATGLGTDSRFSVSADYSQQDNLPDYGLPWVSNSASSDPVAELAPYEGEAPPVAFSNFYGNLYRDFEDIQNQSLTLKYEKDLSENTILRALARTGSVERVFIVTAPRFIDLASSTNVRLSDEKTRDTKDSLNVVQIDLLGNYQTGELQHDVVVGVEVAQEKFERWNYTDVVDDNLDSTPELNDLYKPDAHVAYTGRYARTSKDQQATGDTKAIYAFNTVTLNPEWQVSAGLRYDIFDTEYFYQLDDAVEPNAKFDLQDKMLSWNFGVVYKPVENGSIYFGAGNSFTPSAEDLTTSTRGNAANLDPEETLSYELGTKWELIDGRLFTSAAIFRTEKTNALTDAEDGMYDDDDGRFDTLDGKQRVEGIELSAAGNMTDQFSISAAYTFQKSKVLKAAGDDITQIGNALPRTPEHSFSLWGRYDISDALVFGLGAQYMDERYNSSEPSSRERADSYLIFDMMLSYQISQQWSVQLNGENLTDEAYIDQLGGGHAIPGEARYVSLSTNYSF